MLRKHTSSVEAKGLVNVMLQVRKTVVRIDRIVPKRQHIKREIAQVEFLLDSHQISLVPIDDSMRLNVKTRNFRGRTL